MTKLQFRQIDPREIPVGELAQVWREWFEEEPWCEFWRCPHCNDSMDFGSLGRYEEYGDGACPVCRTLLTPYWSESRTADYYRMICAKPGFFAIGGFDGDRIVAWSWGYDVRQVAELADLPDGGLYVDHVGVLKDYRGLNSIYTFKQGHLIGEAAGIKYFVTRTHEKADVVKRVMGIVGYAFLRRSTSEHDREFWIRRTASEEA